MEKITGKRILSIILSVVVVCIALEVLMFNLGSNKVEDMFSNINDKDYNESVSSVKHKKLSILNDTIELEFELNSGVDFYEASFPLANIKGNDIVLKSIELKGLSASQTENMDFAIMYGDKKCEKFPCKVKETLKKDDTINITIRARNKSEEIPKSDKNVSVKIKFNFISK